MMSSSLLMIVVAILATTTICIFSRNLDFYSSSERRNIRSTRNLEEVIDLGSAKEEIKTNEFTSNDIEKAAEVVEAIVEVEEKEEEMAKESSVVVEGEESKPEGEIIINSEPEEQVKAEEGGETIVNSEPEEQVKAEEGGETIVNSEPAEEVKAEEGGETIVNSEPAEEVKITNTQKLEVIPLSEICPEDFPPSHAMVHDHRTVAVEEYEKYMGDQVNDWNSRWDDTPEVQTVTDYYYAVWNTPHHYICEASAWNPNHPLTQYIHNDRDSSGWVQPTVLHVDTPIKETLDDTDYVAFTSWFHGNYGHFVHDHLPTISFLQEIVPEHTKFLLVDSKVTRAVLKSIDPDFYENRIKWIERDHVYHIKRQLTVSLRKSYQITMGCCGAFDPMRRWMAKTHPELPEKRTVLYYTRGGSPDTTHGRILEPNHEEQIIQHIKAKMEQYDVKEEFVIFNGRDNENKQTLPVETQFNLFRAARTIIGPHGSGLGGNYAWTNPYPTNCKDRTQLLEFIPGTDSAVVQTFPFTTYYNTIRKWPLDYHNILYTAESSYETTYINLDDLDSSLDYMWGGGDPALNSVP